MDQLTLAPTGTSVGAARRFVVDRLRSADVAPEVVETAELLVSELVTNAVLHAHTALSLRVFADAGVRVEVHDQDPRLPRQRRHSAESVTGRGLELVALLATAHGVRPVAGDGKVVWFTIGSDEAVPPLRTPIVTQAPEHRIALIGVPTVLFDVMREHSEALLREFALVALEDPAAVALSSHDVSTADAVRTKVADAVEQQLGPRPRPAGLRRDVVIRITDDDVAGLETLGRVFEAASVLAERGDLLTRPSLPEISALRRWFVSELLGQAAGAAPRLWIDPDTEPPDVRPLSSVAWLASEPAAVIVGDEWNRIVGASAAAAALLGWRPEELGGRRLATVIPPRLRHAHIAGFARHLVTGRTHLIGRPVDVAAWHRDGYEVPVAMLLERRSTDSGPVFLATLTPREE